MNEILDPLEKVSVTGRVYLKKAAMLFLFCIFIVVLNVTIIITIPLRTKFLYRLLSIEVSRFMFFSKVLLVAVPWAGLFYLLRSYRANEDAVAKRLTYMIGHLFIEFIMLWLFVFNRWMF